MTRMVENSHQEARRHEQETERHDQAFERREQEIGRQNKQKEYDLLHQCLVKMENKYLSEKLAAAEKEKN